MASVSCSITINQPVEKVFPCVIAAENHKTWQPGILEAKVTPNGPIGVGSVYHYTTEVMGRKMETQLQVSAYEANRKWSVRTTGVPRPVETVYVFEAAGNSTKLTISMELAGGYPAMAEGMIKQQMSKNLSEQANRIKVMTES